MIDWTMNAVMRQEMERFDAWSDFLSQNGLYVPRYCQGLTVFGDWPPLDNHEFRGWHDAYLQARFRIADATDVGQRTAVVRKHGVKSPRPYTGEHVDLIRKWRARDMEPAA